MLFISNFVLELINYNFKVMKRIVLFLLIAAMVAATVIIWIAKKEIQFSTSEVLQFGVIFLLIAFALLFGYRRTKSFSKGEPQEDELSRKILTKASSVSFYISLYLWLVIMYLSDKSKLAFHTLIGGGILGMAVVFAICWIVIYLRGVRNE
jgi:peptidoglycan/LPS O-acetylase OafA/YrhL